MNVFQFVGMSLILLALVNFNVEIQAGSGSTYKSNSSVCSTANSQTACPPCNNGTVVVAYTYTGATYSAYESSGTDTAKQGTTYCYDTQNCLWKDVLDKQCTYSILGGSWYCSNSLGKTCQENDGIGSAVSHNVTSYTDITPVEEN
jgi:hypothetical protein